MRGRRGFANIELMLFLVIVAVAAAITVPHAVRVHVDDGAHACAMRLDAVSAAAATAGTNAAFTFSSTCPVTGDDYVLQDGKRCCPHPDKHGLKELCRADADPPLAAVHPLPGNVRRYFWYGTAGASGGLFAILLLGNVAMAVFGDRRR